MFLNIYSIHLFLIVLYMEKNISKYKPYQRFLSDVYFVFAAVKEYASV